MTRVGIIGLSHDHIWDVLPDLAGNEDIELVAAASAQLPLLERIKKEYGAATYPDAQEMAAGEKRDAVLIYGNNRAGAEEGVKALERGWHVLIEKPMAANLAGADELLKTSDASDKRLMVNWPIAWWPQLNHAIAMAQAGDEAHQCAQQAVAMLDKQVPGAKKPRRPGIQEEVVTVGLGPGRYCHASLVCGHQSSYPDQGKGGADKQHGPATGPAALELWY